jgi:hypothetical protein
VFDLESRITALTQNYGIMLLLEQNEIEEEVVVRFLVEEGLVDPNDYFFDDTTDPNDEDYGEEDL